MQEKGGRHLERGQDFHRRDSKWQMTIGSRPQIFKPQNTDGESTLPLFLVRVFCVVCGSNAFSVVFDLA